MNPSIDIVVTYTQLLYVGMSVTLYRLIMPYTKTFNMFVSKIKNMNHINDRYSLYFRIEYTLLSSR